MALNSFAFLLVFFPVVCAVLFILRDRVGNSAGQKWLLAASLLFYAASGLSSLALLLCSIAFNWMISRTIGNVEVQREKRRRLLVFGVCVNVALLSVFKYASPTAALLGLNVSPTLELALNGFPLGLSFFTLTQLMYLVDCYEGLIQPSTLGAYSSFVTFFPNVTAGPLLRARRFNTEIQKLGARDDRNTRISQAAALIAIGLVKKVVLGDSFSRVASVGYANAASLSTVESWITTIAGSLEVYFDFSGYSDIAFGCALMLGMSLVRNFNVPYRSQNISEFWKRWHISLSDFITTYLYTPILRSMGRATLRTSAVATIASMLVAGLWHGATWNYVAFGLLHGLALAFYQYWKRLKRPLPDFAAAVLTFAFVNVVFITVKARDLAASLQMAGNLIPRSNLLDLQMLRSQFSVADTRILLAPVVVGAVVAFWGPTAEQLSRRFSPNVKSDVLVVALLLLAYVYMGAGAASEFRYRQF